MNHLSEIDESYVSRLESLNRKRKGAIKKIDQLFKRIKTGHKELRKRYGTNPPSKFLSACAKYTSKYSSEYVALCSAHTQIENQFDAALMEKKQALEKLFVMKRSGYYDTPRKQDSRLRVSPSA